MPQQVSHSFLTTVPDYQSIPLSVSSYDQVSYNQVPHNQPAHINMGQQFGAALPREEVNPHARYASHPQYEQAEHEIVVPPEKSDKPATKPRRKKANKAQLEVLNRTYQRTAYPSAAEREQLATELGMLPRSVQIWYVQTFGSFCTHLDQ